MRDGEEEESKDRSREDGGRRGLNMREMKWVEEENEEDREEEMVVGVVCVTGVIVLTSMKLNVSC